MYLQKHIVTDTYTCNMEIIPDITVTKCTNYIFFRDCVSSTTVSSTSSNMEVDVRSLHFPTLFARAWKPTRNASSLWT